MTPERERRDAAARALAPLVGMAFESEEDKWALRRAVATVLVEYGAGEHLLTAVGEARAADPENQGSWHGALDWLALEYRRSGLPVEPLTARERRHVAKVMGLSSVCADTCGLCMAVLMKLQHRDEARS